MNSITEMVSYENLDRHFRTLAQWNRMSGSSEEAEAFRYINSVMESYGYRTTQYESDALIGVPGSARIELLTEDEQSIPAQGYSMSPGTGETGVTGELVYVGGGKKNDLSGCDVRGKILLSDGMGRPEKVIAGELAGAVGQIHIDGVNVREMCISPVWGSPTPDSVGRLPGTPSVGVSYSVGQRLKEIVSDQTVRIRLHASSSRQWRKIPTLTGDMNVNDGEPFVLFSGHVDSWYYGAMDNATANACQLEVARILASRRDELKRGLRLAFWSGHSHGRYAGSSWYADEHWLDLHRRCICHVNVDSVGAVGATTLENAPTMAETFPVARDILREVAGVELNYRRIGRAGDQSFWGHGISSMFITLSEQGSEASSPTGGESGPRAFSDKLGWWWHTPADTPDKIDSENLTRDTQIYAASLWRLCTDDRLAFDFAAAAAEIAAALADHASVARGTLDLSTTVNLAERLVDSLEALRDNPAANCDRLVIDLGRILVPINYTQDGPFDHDPAIGNGAVPGLHEVSRLALLDPESEEFYVLRTRLIRQRNRIEESLERALRVVTDYTVES